MGCFSSTMMVKHNMAHIGQNNFLRYSRSPMKVLFVFTEKCEVLLAWEKACSRRKYTSKVLLKPETILAVQSDFHPDVVIYDARKSGTSAKSFMTSAKTHSLTDEVIYMAIVKEPDRQSEDDSMLALILSGFHRCLIDNVSIGYCLGELASVERLNGRFRENYLPTQAYLVALSHITDAVCIADVHNKIQFANKSLIKLLECEKLDVIGREIQQLTRNTDGDSAGPRGSLTTITQENKEWEGVISIKKSDGVSSPLYNQIIPILNSKGQLLLKVSIIQQAPEVSRQLERLSQANTIQDSRILLGKRKESIAKIHEEEVQAPIQEAINIITSVREKVPFPMVHEFQRALEILTQKPDFVLNEELTTVQDGNDVGRDLVEGLLGQGAYSRRKSSGVNRNLSHCRIRDSPSSMNNFSEDVKRELENHRRWDFDIIRLETISANQPLLCVGMKIFNCFRVAHILACTDKQIKGWFEVIESCYNINNPYHNSTHAADVLQATAYFLDRPKIKDVFDSTEIVSLLIAAVIHDVGHPGFNSQFLINSYNNLALLYNDISVLESHHVSLGFNLTIKSEDTNILSKVSAEDFRAIRSLLIDFVLATEMNKHFEHVNKFINHMKRNKESVDVISSNADCISDVQSMAHENLMSETKLLAGRILIKCADIANPLRPLSLCKVWAERISEEYFHQTDIEKKRHLPVVMPTFERDTFSVAKSQETFMEFFIRNMFTHWHAFCDIPELMNHMEENLAYWKEKLKEEENKIKEAESESNQNVDVL